MTVPVYPGYELRHIDWQSAFPFRTRFQKTGVHLILPMRNPCSPLNLFRQLNDGQKRMTVRDKMIGRGTRPWHSDIHLYNRDLRDYRITRIAENSRNNDFSWQ